MSSRDTVEHGLLSPEELESASDPGSPSDALLLSHLNAPSEPRGRRLAASATFALGALAAVCALTTKLHGAGAGAPRSTVPSSAAVLTSGRMQAQEVEDWTPHDSRAMASVPVLALGAPTTAAPVPQSTVKVMALRDVAPAKGADDDDAGVGLYSNRAIAGADEEANEGCADTGASCLKSKCCQDPGTQCFTKNAWWAQCMTECVPGPNVLDQTSPEPWVCEALGDRTPGTPKECSSIGEDCRDTQCCIEGGTQCFEKNEYWATCKPECTAGPDLFEKDFKPWSCKALGPPTMGAAPWVVQTGAHTGEDCSPKGFCADPGHQCYRQSQYYAQCRPDCTKGEKRNTWEQPWDCTAVGPRTPNRAEGTSTRVVGQVQPWVVEHCSAEGANCLDTQCCHAVNTQCYMKSKYWGSCKESCSSEPDPNDGNKTWSCNSEGPRSWGLSIKGYPSLFCFSLFMASSYEYPLLQAHLKANAGIFQCDGYDVFAADAATVGVSKDGIEVKAILIPKIGVGVSQDGTAGNAKLFMAVWDKVIAGGRFKNYDWTIKVDPDAVLVAWRIRDHMRPHIGEKVYVVNCNKFPGSPNFPMMYGAVEIFSSSAMIQYSQLSWKCGQQLPWGSWGEDYYMTHCMDFIGVGRIGDFGVLGDNVCTGANCADGGIASFHPFKSEVSWMQCWGQATATR